MEKKIVGIIPVDSATIMVMDPCYVETFWRKKEDHPPVGLEFWGRGADIIAEQLRRDYHHVEETSSHAYRWVNSLPYEQLEEVFKEITQLQPHIQYMPTHHSTMRDIFDATSSKEGVGMISSVTGLDMAAVVTTRADGGYPVYAYFNEEGDLVKIEVEIQSK